MRDAVALEVGLSRWLAMDAEAMEPYGLALAGFHGGAAGPETLAAHAEKAGWHSHVLLETEGGEYLAMLRRVERG